MRASEVQHLKLRKTIRAMDMFVSIGIAMFLLAVAVGVTIQLSTGSGTSSGFGLGQGIIVVAIVLFTMIFFSGMLFFLVMVLSIPQDLKNALLEELHLEKIPLTPTIDMVCKGDPIKYMNHTANIFSSLGMVQVQREIGKKVVAYNKPLKTKFSFLRQKRTEAYSLQEVKGVIHNKGKNQVKISVSVNSLDSTLDLFLLTKIKDAFLEINKNINVGQVYSSWDEEAWKAKRGKLLRSAIWRLIGKR